jgi:hypothetical protein
MGLKKGRNDDEKKEHIHPDLAGARESSFFTGIFPGRYGDDQ